MHTRTEGIGPYTPFHINTTAGTGTALPLGQNVATTAAAVTAGSNVVFTPTSMANVVTGMWLNLSGGTGTTENVRVSSVTTTTFTVATLVNNHSGAYNVISFRPSYFGRLVVNTVGTSTTFTFYNGSPLLYAGGTGAGTAFAVLGSAPIAGQFFYDCYCKFGLFYTTGGTIGSGDYTLTYVDDPVG